MFARKPKYLSRFTNEKYCAYSEYLSITLVACIERFADYYQNRSKIQNIESMINNMGSLGKNEQGQTCVLILPKYLFIEATNQTSLAEPFRDRMIKYYEAQLAAHNFDEYDNKDAESYFIYTLAFAIKCFIEASENELPLHPEDADIPVGLANELLKLMTRQS